MLAADLIRLYPQLFHMAEDGSWASILQHGLLSSASLIERWEASMSLIDDIRSESVPVEHPRFGVAVLRDQKPLDRSSLESALIDMTVEEWLDALNSRVFFSLERKSLSGLLNSPSYRSRPHTVLTIDTASFVAAHGSEIELCAINSGFARPHSKAPRGSSTFVPIAQYSHPHRTHAGQVTRRDVAELSVRGAVHDIADHVVKVERMQRDEVIRVIL